MCTCTNILSQTDTPQLSAVELITIEIHFTGISSKRIIPGVGRIPFHNDFVFTITIDIAHAAIVGRVGIKLPIRIIFKFTADGYRVRRSNSRFRSIQWYLFIYVRPNLFHSITLCYFTTNKGFDDIFRRCRTLGIGIIGYGCKRCFGK